MKHTTAFDSFHGEAHAAADMAELIAGYEAAELEKRLAILRGQ